jgi:hypothetical protein
LGDPIPEDEMAEIARGLRVTSNSRFPTEETAEFIRRQAAMQQMPVNIRAKPHMSDQIHPEFSASFDPLCTRHIQFKAVVKPPNSSALDSNANSTIASKNRGTSSCSECRSSCSVR